jgi:hypothetical protein
MAGFQDRTGCPNKITTIREKFGECFDRMGGVDALLEWAVSNKKSFYNIYAKMASKEIKMENTNRTHEQFIEFMKLEAEQMQLDKGKPMMLVDAPGETDLKSGEEP